MAEPTTLTDPPAAGRAVVPRLHAITPAPAGPPVADPAVLAATRAIVAAGGPLVQARVKAGSDRDRLAAVRALHEAAGPAVFLVNDRIDLALAGGADGVHLGADDLPVDVARRLLPRTALVGATARDPETATAAARAGADYLGVGPVFASTTKTAGLPPPIGLAGVAAVAAAVTIPVLAISGVEIGHVPDLLAAGAHGVAVVAALYGAEDPAAATTAFLDALGGGA